MEAQEFSNRLKRLKEEIITNTPKSLEKIAIIGKSLVQERIQNEGLENENYSNNPIPKSSFYKKALNNSGRNYARSGGFGNWGEFRQSQGLQSNHVDLTYSGRMWASLGVVTGALGGGKFIATLGSRNNEGKDKIEWNTDRYGEFITPNNQEITILMETIEDDLQKLINRYL